MLCYAALGALKVFWVGAHHEVRCQGAVAMTCVLTRHFIALHLLPTVLRRTNPKTAARRDLPLLQSVGCRRTLQSAAGCTAQPDALP